LLIYRINSLFSGNAQFNGINEFDEVYLYRLNSSQTTGIYTQGNLNSASYPTSNKTAFNSTTNPKPCRSDGAAENEQNINNIVYDSETDSYTFFYGDPENRYISFDNTEIFLSKNSESTGTVNITSNVMWRVTIPEYAQNWLSATVKKGINNGAVTFTTKNEPTNEVPRFASVSITDNNQTYTIDITQTNSDDNNIEPYGLNVEVNEGDVLFTWNNLPKSFFDDVESHEDFIISDIGDYILYDGDGLPTYSFGGGTTFPNMGYTGSFIVFNPSQVPNLAALPNIQPYSGNKFLGCFRALGGANNDWLILPKQTISENMILKFRAKSYSTVERMKVGVSTESANPVDFTFLTPNNFVNVPNDKWTEYIFDLSDYDGQEIYISINCVSNNALILMVDDIFVGIPYFEKIDEAFIGYTVYLDGVEKAANIQDKEYLFTNLDYGNYTAGVKAVYDSGSTSIKNISFTVPEVGINNNIKSNILVFSKSNKVYIVNENNIHLKTIQIVDLLGRIIYKGEANTSTTIEVNAASGHYIVKLVTENGVVSNSKIYLTN